MRVSGKHLQIFQAMPISKKTTSNVPPSNDVQGVAKMFESTNKQEARPEIKGSRKLATRSPSKTCSSQVLKQKKTTTQKKKRHKCKVDGCVAAFPYASDLKRHNRKHTGEKPFKCEVSRCNASFSQMAHLTKHRWTHSVDMPYKCEVDGCGASFCSLADQMSHTRSHTMEKPFKCGAKGCEAQFSLAGNLQRHKRIHSGEKPFKCEVGWCDAAFAQFVHLKKHLGTHAEDGAGQQYKLNGEAEEDTACGALPNRKKNRPKRFRTAKEQEKELGGEGSDCSQQGKRRKFDAGEETGWIEEKDAGKPVKRSRSPFLKCPLCGEENLPLVQMEDEGGPPTCPRCIGFT